MLLNVVLKHMVIPFDNNLIVKTYFMAGTICSVPAACDANFLAKRANCILPEDTVNN